MMSLRGEEFLFVEPEHETPGNSRWITIPNPIAASTSSSLSAVNGRVSGIHV